jgi:hypothetical protein
MNPHPLSSSLHYSINVSVNDKEDTEDRFEKKNETDQSREAKVTYHENEIFFFTAHLWDEMNTKDICPDK